MSTSTLAVLGGGHAGHAVAAQLALGGMDVHMYAQPEFSGKLTAVLERGGIEATGIGLTGFARVTATTDIETALRGAEVVFVATHAAAHGSLAELCVPHLVDGQAVVLFSGYGGSLIFRLALQRRGRRARVMIGETSTLPYMCRVTGPARVELMGKPYKSTLLGAIPARDTSELVARVQQFYPIMRPAASVLEPVLLNSNVMRHTIGTLLNIGRIEYAKGEFWIYREGFTPSVWRVFERLDEEKMALLTALALKPIPYMEYRAMISDVSIEEQAALDLKGPSDPQTRYLTEDVPMGLVPRAELGDRLGIPVPTAKALIHLASVINARDHASEGRTLAQLGLGGVPGNALRRTVDSGLLE